jgi:DNA-binding response OmpR family regulator
VLFTSGYTGFDAVSRGLLEEGRDFVQKPLDPEVLARKVREMLDTARRQSPTPAQGTTRTST